MLENFLLVGEQSLVLFFLMCVGYLCAKKGLISDKGVDSLTNLVLYAVVPCSLVRAFQLDATPALLHDFLLSFVVALVLHLAYYAISSLVYRRKGEEERCLYTLCATATNCSFMSFPLQTAIIGSLGIFYGAAYAAVTPLLTFTFGIAIMQGKGFKFSWRTLAGNPGLIGVTVGVAFFLANFRLPTIPSLLIDHLANMTTPLPMIVVGCQLARADLGKVLRSLDRWGLTVLRLIALPLLSIVGMYLCGIRGNILVATSVAASAPVGTIIPMLSGRYGRDTQLAAELVSLSTLCSILTMPLLVAFAQTLA